MRPVEIIPLTSHSRASQTVLLAEMYGPVLSSKIFEVREKPSIETKWTTRVTYRDDVIRNLIFIPSVPAGGTSVRQKSSPMRVKTYRKVNDPPINLKKKTSH
jgi:hypothetical protein